MRGENMIATATTAKNDMRIVVIPAKSREEIKQAAKCLKVAAYCRVSTDEEEQKTSYQAQIEYYTDKINKNPEWQMAGIFADEGITGTQAKKRPQFLKMIRLCRQGKIDVILTKSLSRFARNTVDSLNYIRELRTLGKGKYKYADRGERNADYDHELLRPSGIRIHQQKRSLGSATELQKRKCANAVRKAARL